MSEKEKMAAQFSDMDLEVLGDSGLQKRAICFTEDKQRRSRYMILAAWLVVASQISPISIVQKNSQQYHDEVSDLFHCIMEESTEASKEAVARLPLTPFISSATGTPVCTLASEITGAHSGEHLMASASYLAEEYKCPRPLALGGLPEIRQLLSPRKERTLWYQQSETSLRCSERNGNGRWEWQMGMADTNGRQ
eukprot:g34507.t1